MAEVTWEIIATLLTLGLGGGTWVAGILFKRLDTLNQHLRDTDAEADNQRHVLREGQEKIKHDMSQQNATVHARISEVRVEMHETFATKDSVEKGLDRIHKTIEKNFDQLNERLTRMEQERRDGGAGNR